MLSLEGSGTSQGQFDSHFEGMSLDDQSFLKAKR